MRAGSYHSRPMGLLLRTGKPIGRLAQNGGPIVSSISGLCPGTQTHHSAEKRSTFPSFRRQQMRRTHIHTAQAISCQWAIDVLGHWGYSRTPMVCRGNPVWLNGRLIHHLPSGLGMPNLTSKQHVSTTPHYSSSHRNRIDLYRRFTVLVCSTKPAKDSFC